MTHIYKPRLVLTNPNSLTFNYHHQADSSFCIRMIWRYRTEVMYSSALHEVITSNCAIKLK